MPVIRAGWRPAAAWVCVLALFLNYVVLALLNMILALQQLPTLEPMNLGEMMGVVFPLLGLGVYRTFEKHKGVA